MPTITIPGFLAGDPEMRYTNSGSAVTHFSIPHNYQRRGQNGEVMDRVNWYNCVAFGRLAEIMNNHGVKGRYVVAEGELEANDYVDRDGITRTRLEVIARHLSFGPRTESQGTRRDTSSPAPEPTGPEEVPW